MPFQAPFRAKRSVQGLLQIVNQYCLQMNQVHAGRVPLSQLHRLAVQLQALVHVMQGTRGQTEERAQFALLVNIKWIRLPLKEEHF